jgi:membrane-bound ClpP family serine protease
MDTPDKRRSSSPEQDRARTNGRPPRRTSGYIAPPEINSRLSRAEELIRRAKMAEARAILDDVRRYAVRNPRYWWTAVRAARDPQEAVAALIEVIRLRPRDDEAWAALRKLDPNTARTLEVKYGLRSPEAPRPSLKQRLSRRARLLIFALIAAVVLAILAVLVISGGFTL